MLVNRIYFRGIKTFQRLFVFSLLLIPLTGCVNLGDLHIQSTPVSFDPQIIDLEVNGACKNALVGIGLDLNKESNQIAVCRQVLGLQGERAVYRSRVDLSSVFGESIDTPEAITIRIQCPDHGDRNKIFPIPRLDPAQVITPDWAKGLVWYQVFPDRFRDGNPNNNPNMWDSYPASWDLQFGESHREEIERAWNRRLVDPRHYPYSYNRSGGSLATVVFARRFGGDLIGVYEKLESLKDQGFTGIYLCPVFQSRSLHKYDADDHRHIDPTLGHPDSYKDIGPGNTKLALGEDAADERTWGWTVSDRWFVDVFLPKAKSLGLRVILDGVWNHVGVDHFAFSDVMENGQQSSFVDWFDVEFDKDGKLFAWQGWGSVNGNLPEFKQTEDGDLAQGPKAHIMAVTRRWMDPNGDGDPSDGIDGWRLDVAGEIGKPFWKDWREQVRRMNPEALIIAEIWGDADRMLNDEAFDGQMNYPFAYPVANWLSIGEMKGDSVECARRLNAVFHHSPQHDLVQFNLMTSHDTERLASLMHNDSVRGYDSAASRFDKGSLYDPDSVEEHDRLRALAAIALMVASPGSPMVYNGDEYAMPGADDPDNRRPIQWGSLEGDEGDLNVDQQVRFNRVVNELLVLRTDPDFSDVLRYGDVEFVGIADGEAAGALIVRRMLNNRMIEFLIDDQPIDLVVDSGWEVLGSQWSESRERSRKYGLNPGLNNIRVRYMVSKISTMD